jgi:hypothetical protein
MSRYCCKKIIDSCKYCPLKYLKKPLLLIAIATTLRLWFATATGLNGDEVYYWTYALKLQWNYFDHPPMVALLIRLSTFNLLFHNELFVRLGAIIASAICTWLIFRIGTLINNVQTGWYAALLYTASIYASLTAGSNILPDSPQMIFWLASIFLLIKISREDELAGSKIEMLWLFFGLTTGLCIMSKVTGVFIWIGAVLFMLSTRRDWLKNRSVYLAAGITLIIISPIVIWNIQHSFITYTFHSGRLSITGHGVDFAGFAKAIIQQISISNPFVFFLICANLVLVFRGKSPIDKQETKLLLFCSLPMIGIILIISLFRETFAHWSAPAYTCLVLFPAVNLATAAKNKSGNIPRVIKWALGYLIFIALSQIAIANYFPGTLSTIKQGPKTGADDITLDTYGWQQAGAKFDSLYNADISNKIMPKGAPVVITNWWPAAAIEFYITHKTGQQVIGIGNVEDLHQYYWTNAYKKPLKDGDDAYYIVPSDSFYYRTFNQVARCFTRYNTALVFTQYRSGFICRYITVYRMRGYLKAPHK